MSKQTASTTSNSRGAEYRPAFWAMRAARDPEKRPLNQRYRTLVALKKR